MYGGPSTAIAAVPKELAIGERAPLVILLPGGHHNMQGHVTGVWGWWCEYMLGDTDTALRRGTLTPRDFQQLVRPAELATFNRLLALQPFRGAVYVTPWVVGRQLDPQPHGTMVGDFLRDVVSRCRTELPVIDSREATGLGGMSSGGLWTIYSGSLCSDLFGTLVATQPFTDDLVKPLREVVSKRARPQRLRMVSSVDDHQKKSTTALSAALTEDGVEHEYYEYLGAHSAGFAAGPGGLDALLQFDRALRGENLDGTRDLPVHDGLAAPFVVGEGLQRPPMVRAPTEPIHVGGVVALSALVVGSAAVGVTLAAQRAKKNQSPKPIGPEQNDTRKQAPSVEVEIDVPVIE